MLPWFLYFRRWWAGPWQLCPSSCGESSKVYRTRSVLCVEQTEQEPIVYTQPIGIRTYGGIEYVENSKKDARKSKEYIEQETMALPDDKMALDDSKCKGQEKPIEQELCPNLPPCDEKPYPTTPGVEGNGFDYELDDLEFLNLLNISSYDWIVNLDKKDKKVRHETKKGNETMKIFDTPLPAVINKEKKPMNKKHKKIKRKKKEKYKKIAKIGEIEELQNDSKYDEVFLHKNSNSNYQLLTTAKSNNAFSYIYYNDNDKKIKPKFDEIEKTY